MTNLAEQKQKYTDTDVNGPGPLGDCFRTAIACLLEIDRDSVPNFADDDAHREPWEPNWWEKAVEFVEKKKPGWTIMIINPIYPVYSSSPASPKKAILSAKSPRGDFNHCVLVNSEDGKMVWDPHPSNEGIIHENESLFVLTGKMVKSKYTFNFDYSKR